MLYIAKYMRKHTGSPHSLQCCSVPQRDNSDSTMSQSHLEHIVDIGSGGNLRSIRGVPGDISCSLLVELVGQTSVHPRHFPPRSGVLPPLISQQELRFLCRDTGNMCKE